MIRSARDGPLRPHLGAEGRARARSHPRQGRQPRAGDAAVHAQGRWPSDVAKVLRSAIANAQQKEGFSGDVDRLFVSACYANQGPSQKRVRPAPMGRAFRVLKRTAHLTVRVSERPEKVVRVPRRGDDEPAPRQAARAQARRSRRPTAKSRRQERRSNCGPEGSPVRIPARVQQDVAVAVVLGPRLREAAARGSGAALRR